MKFPFLSFLKKQAPKDYFLALLFRDEEIRAVVFEQLSGRIQVIGEGKSQLSQSVETISDETLLDTCDKSISIAESSLPNGIQTHKTVFGVKETWVSDSHITKENLTKLKQVGQQLDLQPIGFLVFPEAIAHLLQKEEGAPVSAILIDTGKKQITLTLIRAGRIVETKEIPIGESLTQTVEEGLKKFENVEIFPSRLILFDKGDKTTERQFLSHHWSKSLPFLHVPQVSTLPEDFDTRAILFGTATQMGFDAIDLVKKPLTTKAMTFEEFQKEERFEQNEKTEQEESSVIATPDAGPEGKQSHEIKKNEHEAKETSNEFFGFVKNADISEEGQIEKSSFPNEVVAQEVTNEIPEEEKEEELPADTAYGFSASGPIFFEGAKNIFAQLKVWTKKISFARIIPMFGNLSEILPGKKLGLLAIPLVIILILAGFIWYLFGLHANVTLVLSPNSVTQDLQATFSTDSNTDLSKKIITAKTIDTTEDGSVSGNATGTKDVGTPAKGSVTIFNSDNQEHQLTSGTKITSSNGLNFTLDSDVTIASGSSDPTNLSAGTATVNITSSDIGTDYNLPSNTKFTIGTSSVLAGKNSNALSGGTKKSITIVSQKDIDNLVEQLTNNLKDKAKSDILGKVNQDSGILPDFISTSVSKQSPDKKVGDEASSVNLTATIDFTTLTYLKSDIQNLAKQAFNGKLPQNESFDPNGFTFTTSDLATKGNNTNAKLSLKVSAIPQIDKKSLAQQIAGKSFAASRDILSGVPQFSDATFKLSPNLFFLPKSLPRFSGNINIDIQTNE